MYICLLSVCLSVCCIVYVFSIEFGTRAPEIVKKLWGWYGTSDIQYSSTGKGIKDSGGWMQTQSLFNILEVILQLTFLFGTKRNSIESVMTIMIASVATLWKTLMYMSIIYFSADPVNMVPLLSCFGLKPLPENEAAVQASLVQDNCLAQWFKFQFNFYWIIWYVPLQ